MSKKKIKIDIFSDVICPWCYIGEHRLKKAMDEAGDTYEFEVNFKAFELNANIPQEGMTREAYFKNNYGESILSQLDTMDKRMTDNGRAEGIQFDFKKAGNVFNTFNGHRLIWLAGEYGVQEQVVNALFKAYFTEGKNVNDTDLLTEIGVASGIPASKLEGFFSSEEGKKEVRQMEQFAQAAGVTGVPAFVINDKYLVKGAQPAETFLNVFPQVVPVFEELNLNGDSCGVDGCE
jgi:predicted DsbA family dithiol-disulfide isomerase